MVRCVATLGQLHRPPGWVWVICDRYPPFGPARPSCTTNAGATAAKATTTQRLKNSARCKEWPSASVTDLDSVHIYMRATPESAENLPTYRTRRLSWSSWRLVFAKWKLEPLATSLSLR
jgi:hypothetical protein